MTTLEALVSISLTALRARGQWHTDGLEQTLRGDIRAMVGDCAKIIRADDFLVPMAVRELERCANLPASCDKDTVGCGISGQHANCWVD